MEEPNVTQTYVRGTLMLFGEKKYACADGVGWRDEGPR
jgi:hypothetical protein